MAHSLRIQFLADLGKAWYPEFSVSGHTPHLQLGSKEMDSSSCIGFFSYSGSPATQWYHLHVRSFFTPLLPKSKDSFQDVTEACSLGDSRSMLNITKSNHNKKVLTCGWDMWTSPKKVDTKVHSV